MGRRKLPSSKNRLDSADSCWMDSARVSSSSTCADDKIKKRVGVRTLGLLVKWLRSYRGKRHTLLNDTQTTSGQDHSALAAAAPAHDAPADMTGRSRVYVERVARARRANHVRPEISTSCAAEDHTPPMIGPP